ncbi:MAG: hypothetical protein OXH41_10030 [Chloroflexi bacterium]|nr:hypothetical protein [Chloroflexota bacterium]
MKRMKPWILTAAVAALALSFVTVALAQPSPPSAFTGTVTGADGDVATGLSVEAFVGDTLCNNSPATTFSRSGVTSYFVTVHNASTRDGCDGDIRFEIGGQAAAQTAQHGGSGPVTLNLTLAQAARVATVHVAVWRSTSNPDNLYLSTRPEGGSWTTHDDDGPLSMSVFGSGRFERSDDLIPVDVDLGNGSTATVHVAVWRSTSNPDNLYLSTRPEGGTWTTHDDDGPLSMSVFGSGRFERSDDLIPVDVELE